MDLLILCGAGFELNVIKVIVLSMESKEVLEQDVLEYQRERAIEYIAMSHETNPNVDGWVINHDTGNVRVRVSRHPVFGTLTYMNANGNLLSVYQASPRSNERLFKTEAAWGKMEKKVLNGPGLNNVLEINALTEEVIGDLNGV